MPSPSFDDLYALGRAELLVLRPDLFVNEGDVTDVLLNAAAAMADKAIQQSVANLRKTFVNTASGDDLTTLVQDHYGIERQSAVFSIGSVEFTRSTGALPAGTILTGTVVGTDFDSEGNRVEFTTNQDVAWAASETGTKSVEITASITGSDSNVGANTITNIVSSIFDGSITVDNPAETAGGNEEESDVELRERARTFVTTLRRGTISALEFGAKQIASVRNATAIEDTNSGIVSLYVSDVTGQSNAQMLSDVTTEIENWRCAGTVVNVLGASLVSQNVDVSITARAGFDASAIEQDIIDAITSTINKLFTGDDLTHDLIQTAVRNVNPDNIISVTVNTPLATTVVSADNELIRAGTVTVS